MAAITPVVVGGKVTATTENLEIAAIGAMGTRAVVPTSVSGSGVTVGASGAVTLATVTTGQIRGCFTSDYEAYEIIVDVALTTTGSVSLQLVLTTTADASAVYDYTRVATTGTTANNDQQLAQTSWSVGANGNGPIHFARITLARPALASPTRMQSQAVATPNPMTTAATVGTKSGIHRTSSGYDGFAVTFGAAATGTIRIYGINNN